MQITAGDEVSVLYDGDVRIIKEAKGDDPE